MSHTPQSHHSTPTPLLPPSTGFHLRHLLSSSPDNGTGTGTASPANTSEPFTPPPLYPLSPYNPPPSATCSALEFDDLIDSEQVLMTPPTRPGLVHAQTYAYGSGEYNSTSQERTTATTDSPQVDNAPQPQWPPKADEAQTVSIPHPNFTNTTMLPPIRTAYPPVGTPMYWQASYPPHPAAPPSAHAHAQPHTAPPMQGFASMAQHAQYPGAPSYLAGPYAQKPYAYPAYTHHPQAGYQHYSQHYSPQPPHPSATPTSASTQAGLYTPATQPAYGIAGGTIQPSAFSGWSHSGQDTATRLGERRQSVSSLSEKEERYEVKPSPASLGESGDSDAESAATIPATGTAAAGCEGSGGGRTYKQGGVEYTTDAEVKQTPELKRMCFNCEAKSPPSWRKSVMNPGRILCNKCGIYERTHRRARPPQGDESKLRKSAPATGFRREAPPPLSMQRTGPVSPSPSSSLYSSVPSQNTPSSTTAFTFPQHPPMPPHMSATSLPYAAHTGSPSTFHPPATYKRYSQVDHTQPYGSSSPYGAAYARRGASYQTTPTMGLRGVGGTMGMPGDAAFYDQGRRHSDATANPPLTAPLSAALSASTSSDAPMSAGSQAESPALEAQA